MTAGGSSVDTDIVSPAGNRASRRLGKKVAVGVIAFDLVIGFVPALLLRPLSGGTLSAVEVPTWVVTMLTLLFLRSAEQAGKMRYGSAARYVTARTFYGDRTLDLGSLRSVRAYAVPSRSGVGSGTYLLLRDTAGTRIAFSKRHDLAMIRAAIDRQRSRPGTPRIRVSPFARSVLASGIWASVSAFLWSLASSVVFVLCGLVLLVPITATAMT